MAEVTAALVKELRDKTGAGMMDCKRALGETGGDIEAAVDWLRKKGLAAAAKKAGRVAAEGLIGAATRRQSPAPWSRSIPRPISSPATSCSRRSCARSPGCAVAGNGDVEALKEMPYPGTRPHGRRGADGTGRGASARTWCCAGSARLAVGRGVVASYVHNSLAPGLGKIGVLVALESDGFRRGARGVGPAAGDACRRRQPAISRYRLGAGGGARPRTRRLARAGRRQRQVGRDRRRAWSRAGCANSTKRRCCSIRSSSSTARRRVAKVVEAAAKEAGAPIRVAGFVRLALGEGVEKPPTDFAAEVGATLKG